MKKITGIILACLCCAFFTGCASIVDGGSKTVQISSNPEGAKVTISNKSGKDISVLTTPATVSLERSSGYFSGEDYKLVFAMPGYYPSEVHIKSTVDGWYFGNIIFGGLIGFLIVDPATGDMYNLSPREVTRNLVSSSVPLTPEEITAADLKLNPPPATKPRQQAGKAHQ